MFHATLPIISAITLVQLPDDNSRPSTVIQFQKFFHSVQPLDILVQNGKLGPPPRLYQIRIDLGQQVPMGMEVGHMHTRLPPKITQLPNFQMTYYF